MKFILSRKGFDFSFGGTPSPILPDGRMLSLPIPEQDSKGKAYDTGRKFCQLAIPAVFQRDGFCHLDPDIRPELHMILPDNWKPLFGQCGTAQSHLANQRVGENDIFLFFGLFQTVDTNLRPAGRPFHAIWGYLQIGEIISHPPPFRYSWHPHTKEYYQKFPQNTLYAARESLEWDKKIPGCGTFLYHEQSREFLTLTGKEKKCVTHWNYNALPWIDPNEPNSHMTCHTSRTRFKENYFQAASRGQEFVLDEKGSSDAKKRFLQLLKFRNRQPESPSPPEKSGN